MTGAEYYQQALAAAGDAVRAELEDCQDYCRQRGRHIGHLAMQAAEPFIRAAAQAGHFDAEDGAS